RRLFVFVRCLFQDSNGFVPSTPGSGIVNGGNELAIDVGGYIEFAIETASDRAACAYDRDLLKVLVPAVAPQLGKPVVEIGAWPSELVINKQLMPLSQHLMAQSERTVNAGDDRSLIQRLDRLFEVWAIRFSACHSGGSIFKPGEPFQIFKIVGTERNEHRQPQRDAHGGKPAPGRRDWRPYNNRVCGGRGERLNVQKNPQL